VSQTCDVLQVPEIRRFVSVAALVRLWGSAGSRARAGHQPRYVHLPGIGEEFFADLDLVATVPKRRLASWRRVPGVNGDREVRELSRAVGRYYSRFAFPDALNPAVRRLVQRLKDRRHKASREGEAVDALRDIRVIADPEWEAAEVRVNLIFLLPPSDATNDPLTDDEWESQVDAWQALCDPQASIVEVKALGIRIDEWPVADYLLSDPLDVEYLSPAVP
ncbi:MAG: hypothetical protein M3R21_04435, partial [Candidatus Dormibacteraeota bacterium]|nr:hypothetical protein [Candidatus Dormibacteraeota bacterium]